MKHTNRCPKCGSSDISANATAVDRGHGNIQQELSVATFRKPDAIVFKGQVTTALSAWVCAECGYVEFYADSPEKIKVVRSRTC